MDRISYIIHILSNFLPKHIILNIIYKYNGFRTPSCKIVKLLINNCKKFKKRVKINNNLQSINFKRDILDIICIQPKIIKIYKFRNNKNILICNYINKIYKVNITFSILCTDSNKKITKGTEQILFYYNL